MKVTKSIWFLLALAAMFLASVPAFTQEVLDLTDSDAGVKEIVIENDGLSYVIEEIRVNEGDRIRLTYVNTGGFHDWVLDEFDAATKQIPAGQEDTIEFVADEAGEYEFYCSVGNHRARGMYGSFIVVAD